MTPHERELRRLLDKLVLDAASMTLLTVGGFAAPLRWGEVHARLAAQKDAIIRLAMGEGVRA